MLESADDHIAALQAQCDSLRAEMQNFAATVSHDLRAPLRHIVSYTQLVVEDTGPQLTAEAQGFLTTIADSARHMGVLLDALSDWSRLGSAPVVLGPVALQRLVLEVSADLTAAHPHRVLQWHIAPDLPLVQADVSLLRLVIDEVLANAVKFTAPRDVAVIEVDAAVPNDANGLVQWQVRDNGVGFNPAMAGKLFQVFGKLHSSKQFDGVGMGLAKTRKALQRIGGTADIVGVEQVGCSVTLGLPGAAA